MNALMSTSSGTLDTIEQMVLSDPMDAGKWLVYLDCCQELGLSVGALTELLSQLSESGGEIVLEREPGFEIVIEVPDGDSRCTVQIRLAPRQPGATGRSLSARWRREMPPLDWLVSYPWESVQS